MTTCPAVLLLAHKCYMEAPKYSSPFEQGHNIAPTTLADTGACVCACVRVAGVSSELC